MAVSKDFLEYILDQLSRWGGVSVLRMFGGAGLFRDGIMFDLVANDVTYLKVDDTTKDKYVVEGSSPLKPFPDKSTVLSYYELPGDILENPEKFIDWAGESLSIQMKQK